jgi:hypothetical protein
VSKLAENVSSLSCSRPFTNSQRGTAFVKNCRSASDPIVAVRSAAFGARNLPFIHFHRTAKSGPSAEEGIREIKRLFKIEKNPPTVTRAEGRLTRRGGFSKSTASSPTTITAHNGRGSL